MTITTPDCGLVQTKWYQVLHLLQVQLWGAVYILKYFHFLLVLLLGSIWQENVTLFIPLHLSN